jgi:protein involved in polysaccharide export with SLBB domain
VNSTSTSNLQHAEDINTVQSSPVKNYAMLVANPNETNSEYILHIGDVLDIKFFYNSELNELLPIRPDGMISLQLIDEVRAAGMTSSELDKILTEKYSVIFEKPEITVIVKDFGGQKVYVGGEVANPRVVSMVGNVTSLQAILDAGGFRETAQPDSVIIISKGEDNTPVVRKVNLKKVISGDPLGSDAFLRPFDIVYVPKSFIANVNKFVEQYIEGIVPDFLSGGFSYTRQSGTVETIPAK